MLKRSCLIGIIAIALLVIGGGAAKEYLHEQSLSDDWKEVRESVRLQVVRSNASPTSIVKKSFTPELDIAYVVHEESTYTFITNEQLRLWRIDFALLEETAVANTEKTSIEVDMGVREFGSPPERYGILETGDGYDAVRMFLPAMQKKMASYTGYPIVVAIPTRDFLIFWKDEFKLHDEFATQVRKEFEADKEYPVSQALFRISKDGSIESSPNTVE